MLNFNYRKHILISFIIGVAFLVLHSVTMWNGFKGKDNSPGIIPFIFLVIAILAIGYILYICFRIYDPEAVENLINSKVKKERVKVLREIQKAEEDEKAKASVNEADDKIKQILPTGKFNNIEQLGKRILVNLADNLGFVQGVFFVKADENYEFVTGYAIPHDHVVESFTEAEGLNGQVVKSKSIMLIDNIPEDYFSVESGLGKSKPGSLIIVPVIINEQVIAVIELASFRKISELTKNIIKISLDKLSGEINKIIKS